MAKKLFILLGLVLILGLGFLTGFIAEISNFKMAGLKSENSQIIFRQDQIIYTLLSSKEFSLRGYIFERQGGIRGWRTKQVGEFYTNPRDGKLHFSKRSDLETIYDQDNNGVEIHIRSWRESNGYPYMHLIGKIWMPTNSMVGVENIQDLKMQAVLHGTLFKLGQNKDAQEVLRKYFGNAELHTGNLPLEAGVYNHDEDDY